LILAKIAKSLKTSVENLLKIMVMASNFEQFRGENPHKNESSAQEGAGQGLSLEKKAELQERTYFPNNLRAADLLMREILKRTTPKEEAELDGYFIFRDNLRAADLLKSGILGQTTEEELIQHKNQHGKFSPEVNSLWDKVKARDSNVEKVDMSQGKAIKVSPEDDEKIIWTHGLGGCYACLVFTEHTDGTRNAILTHYPETQIHQNLEQLRELIGQSKKMKEASTKQVVLMAPGEWVQNPTTKEWFLRVKNQQIADLLTLAVQVELECGVYVKLEPYSEMLDIDKKDQGTLLVYVPPVGKGEAHYRTWFSGGTLGTQEPKN